MSLKIGLLLWWVCLYILEILLKCNKSFSLSLKKSLLLGSHRSLARKSEELRIRGRVRTHHADAKEESRTDGDGFLDVSSLDSRFFQEGKAMD
nr:hypothetical protein [Tanacetum cinerariifolium]